MENRSLNWIIFGLVALVIIFATLALLYSSSITGFLGFSKTQSAHKQIVVVMPKENSNSQVSTSSSSANTQNSGVVRLFFVSGASPTNNQPEQTGQPTRYTYTHTDYSQEQNTYAPSTNDYNTQNYNTQQESNSRRITNTQSSDYNNGNYNNNNYNENNYDYNYNNIPEKQVQEIQYIQVPERVVYIDGESGVFDSSDESDNREQPKKTTDRLAILSSNLPGSNFNIPAEQSPDIPTEPKTGFVDINNFEFFDSSKIITIGDSVTWINNDRVAHTVTSDSGGELNSRLLQPGDSYTHTFDSVGTFYYHCSIHPSMRGVIIVSDRQLTTGHIPFLGNQQYPLRG